MTTSTVRAAPLLTRRELQRTALFVLVASLAVSAAMGVYALLIGEFEETQGKLLATSLSVSGAGALAMACGTAWERHRLGLLPRAGIALAILGFALVILGVWPEQDADAYWRTTATVLAFAVAAAHASVVTPHGLQQRYRWVFLSAYALNAIVTALAIFSTLR